jgi:sulfatase maturation enzyme AslB (radical SAM superfamily)
MWHLLVVLRTQVGVWILLMTEKRYVCSKMFTDVNIKFPYNCVKNCCKSNDYVSSVDDVLSEDFFLSNPEYIRRKTDMMVHNKLPVKGCDTCINTGEYSLFETWNTWNNEKQNDPSILSSDLFETYEFVLSSACDLKCVYCHPKDSTSWAKEKGVPPNKGSDKWKQSVIAKLIESLKTKKFREDQTYTFFFSGGEPTYNTETLEFVNEILKYVPKKNTNICISTNANTKPKVFQKYLNAVQSDTTVNWIFDCSIDGIGEVCEAIRHGISWSNAIQNIDTLLQQPNVTVRISPTVNLYSIPTMSEFVHFFVDLFQKHGKIHNGMFNYNMAQEAGMSPANLPLEYNAYLDESISYLKSIDVSYHAHLENIKNIIGTDYNEYKTVRMAEKFQYFKDKRPETDWEGLFPHIVKIIGKHD